MTLPLPFMIQFIKEKLASSYGESLSWVAIAPKVLLTAQGSPLDNAVKAHISH